MSSDNISSTIEYIINLQTQYNSINFVGDGACLYKDLIISKLSNKFNNILFPENSKNFACSISIAKSAYNRYKHGEFGYSNSLVPLYLRPSQAEQNIKG